MAEAGEGEPKRCQCGFWGSPKTMNLCSKCYQAYLQKGQAGQVDGEGSSESTLLQPYYRDKQMPEDSNTNMGKEGGEGDGEPEKEAVGEGEKKESEGAEEEDVFLPVDRPVQKNKKRCWVCKAKLELAQRELGGCKCGYVYCFLHRLPEQHECIYDHKEGGRQEAMKNMVVTGRKKIGRSFHRMDSRPE